MQGQGIPGLRPRAVIVARTPISDVHDVCPVCESPFEDMSFVDECSVEPGDLNNKHCFKAAGGDAFLLVEHSGESHQVEEEQEREKVKIDVQ